MPTPSAPLAALLAVRRDNFTTRQSVYYAAAGCNGAAYLLDPVNPSAGTVGEVSELYAAQGTAFAIGTTPPMFAFEASGRPAWCSTTWASAHNVPPAKRPRMKPRPDFG